MDSNVEFFTWYLPLAHVLQLEALLLEAYVPGEHLVQELAPFEEYFPFPQFLHVF